MRTNKRQQTHAALEAAAHLAEKLTRTKAALRALVADIEGMQMILRADEGDPAAHDAERVDYFGPFTQYYDDAEQTMVSCEAGVRICWPNLRILLEQAKATLGDS